MDIVDPADWWPVFPPLELRQWKGRLLAGVGPRPLVGRHAGRRVRGPHHWVVVPRPMAVLHSADLLTDGNHRRDEPVELGQVLAFGWLNHQGAGYRKAEGRGVKAIVDEPLGHVLGSDAAGLLQWPEVEDALVGHPATLTAVERGVVVTEPDAYVIRRKDCRFGRLPQADRTHHADVHPTDWQHTGIPQSRR